MVRNYFYLIVGLLCILFSVTHSLNGLTTTLTTLNNSQIDNSTKISFTYIWHIIGIENLIMGIALLIMSFSKSMLNVKFTAWLIILLFFGTKVKDKIAYE